MTQPIVHDDRTDAERDGSLYVTPHVAGSDTVWAPILDITADPLNGALHEDTPLSDAEEEIIGTLFGKPVPLVRSRDACHRQQRLNRALDRIIALDEPDQSEAIRFMEGLIDGLREGHERAA